MRNWDVIRQGRVLRTFLPDGLQGVTLRVAVPACVSSAHSAPVPRGFHPLESARARRGEAGGDLLRHGTFV
jgi:hypothetical protein